jgi:DNA polymerase-3 subunit alpha
MGAPRFSHLHQHTQYSLLDGAAKIKDLLKWVKEVSPERPACAITDHGNMHGVLHFYRYASELDVKPVLGYEAYLASGSRLDRRVDNSSVDGGYYHLTLLAKTFEGYQNLCRLSSRAYLEGYYYKPRIDHEILEEHHRGLIVLSGCLGAEVPQLILKGRLTEARKRVQWYQSVFGEDYFLEIQDHGLPEDRQVMEVLRGWAGELGIGMVATNDGHYVRKEDALAHEMLLAIQTKATLSDEKRFKFPCNEFYVKSPEEMRAALPGAVWGDEPFDNSNRIADLCSVELPIGKQRVYQMPALPIPEGRTMAEELRIRTYLGLSRRFPDLLTERLYRHYLHEAGEELELLGYLGAQPSSGAPWEQQLEALAKMGSFLESRSVQLGQKYVEYKALDRLERQAEPPAQLAMDPAAYRQALVLLRRAEYELAVINRMGFPDYFLIVADYINWSKDHGISVGPGRGSGAGSLVAYAIRITNVDPLAFGLLFERFLNPDRVSMPDFDVDFSDTGRDAVIQYVRSTYGDDKVAQIATFGTMASKAVLRDVARVSGLPYADADRISKMIPVKFGRSISLEEAKASVPDIDAALKAAPELAQVFEAALKLEGLTRHASVHAAGVVIGRRPLSELVPLMRDTSGQGVVCQYDMKSVEDIGLIKMDFLGLRTLSFLEEARRILKESRGRDVDFDAIPIDDAATFDLLSRGDTKGIFQFEGGGIADASRRLKPRRIGDIIALSALYRPGPMENIPAYIRRHHGQEEVSYKDFPHCERWLSQILVETYGIPVYQEQIMQIASEVAGYSLGEADLLRRAMGKKDLQEMHRQRGAFVAGAGRNGVPEEEASKLFDLLEAFANYGYNKSHSAAYGMISYQTAWLKANYPVEFMAALLTVERRDSTKVAEYIADAHRMGIPVLPPDINRSGADFKVDGKEILFGLYAVKNVGETAVRAILDERQQHGPYRGLADFCQRNDLRSLNRRALESLIKAGAFDSFGHRQQLLNGLADAVGYAQQTGSRSQGMLSLFSPEQTEPALPSGVPELSKLERLALEREVLGLYISGHPLEEYPGLRGAAHCQVSELETWFESKGQTRAPVVLAGVLESISKKPTRSGGMMAKFNLADASGTIELVAFGRSYGRLQDKLQEDHPVVVIAEVDRSEGGLRVVAEEILTAGDLGQFSQVVHIAIDLDQVSAESLVDLSSYLDERSGQGGPPAPVQLHVASEEGYAVLETERLRISPQAVEDLNRHFSWLEASLGYDAEALLRRAESHRREGFGRRVGAG